MDREQRLVYVQTQIVGALARIEGMKAENRQREADVEAPAYGEDAFEDVATDFGLTHNQVVAFLAEGK